MAKAQISIGDVILVQHSAVALMEMTFRKGKGTICRDISVSEETLCDQDYIREAQSLFRQRVHQYNTLLRLKVPSHPNVSFIHQKGRGAQWRDHLREDGVHLTSQSMAVYARNVSIGIIHNAKRSVGVP